MGGYNVLGTSISQKNEYFQRVYTNLPDHGFIRMTFTLYIIDSWDSSSAWTDSIKISYDNKVLTQMSFSMGNFGTDNYCGANTVTWYDLMNFRLFGVVAHTNPTFTFRLTSLCDELSDNESFGFRNINFLFDNNDNIATSGLCTIAPTSSSTYTSCTCPEGQYSLGGPCLGCDASCSSCFAAGSTGCYQCAPGYFWSGAACLLCDSSCSICFGTTSTQCNQCKTNYFYLAWNNECSSTCPYPLVSSYDYVNSQLICSSPCSATQYVNLDGTCQSTCPDLLTVEPVHSVLRVCATPCSPTEYLYWDGTCGQDCGYPLTQNVFSKYKFCQFGCPSNQYMYWNGTCSAACLSPFVTRTQNGRYFCHPPCDITQYLNWDGTCQLSCTLPLSSSTIGGVQQCSYPCLSSQYLYWNATCSSVCNFPLSIRTTNGMLFCDYPSSTLNYLYWDGTSSTACTSPLVPRIEGTGSAARKYCDYPCSISQFMYWNGTCQLECDFPLVTYIKNNRQYCGYPCTAGSQYLYWNGSCLSTCPSPLSTRTENGYTFCDYLPTPSNFLYWDTSSSSTCAFPLSKRYEGVSIIRKFCDFPCIVSQFLYWNGTCQATCPLPLANNTIMGRKFCYNSTNFLYFNGSLIPTCDSPFTQFINGAQKYCNHPCSNPSYFYYVDNTCSASCAFPLQQQINGALKWCLYPCEATQFLYADGVCREICDPFFTQTLLNGDKYCNDPCPSTKYVYWNGSCLPTCPAPFRSSNNDITITSRLVCQLPCNSSTEFYFPQTEECGKECYGISLIQANSYLECQSKGAPIIQGDQSSILSVILESAPGGLSLNVPANIVSYIRYLNIPMSLRLQKLTLNKGRSILSLKYGKRMSDDIRAKFGKSTIPTVFENQDLHSNFLVNIWEDFTSFVILAIITLTLRALEEIMRMYGWTIWSSVFEKTKIIFKWNVCLVVFATSINDVILYSSLEFSSFKPGLAYSAFGLELSIFVVIGFIAFIAGVFYLASQFETIRHKIILNNIEGELEAFCDKWESFQILFRGFRRAHPLFFFLYTVRIGFPILLSSALYSHPMTQIIIQMVFNVIVLYYIIILKPLIRMINHIQLIIVESLAFLISVTLLVMNIAVESGAIFSGVLVIMCDLIVLANAAIHVTMMIFLAIKLVDGVRAIRQYQKSQFYKDKTLWVQLLVFVMQQGGMGFEEMFINQDAAKAFKSPEELVENEDARNNVEREKLLRERERSIFSTSKKESVKPIRSEKKEKSTLFSLFNRKVQEKSEIDADPDVGEPKFGAKESNTISEDEHKSEVDRFKDNAKDEMKTGLINDVKEVNSEEEEEEELFKSIAFALPKIEKNEGKIKTSQANVQDDEAKEPENEAKETPFKGDNPSIQINEFNHELQASVADKSASNQDVRAAAKSLISLKSLISRKKVAPEP